MKKKKYQIFTFKLDIQQKKITTTLVYKIKDPDIYLREAEEAALDEGGDPGMVGEVSVVAPHDPALALVSVHLYS